MTDLRGSERARRTAIRLLGRYPRPWRARYQREMQALLEEMPVGWRQVANLAATCASEWLSPRALGWPARSATGRVQVARYLMFAVFAYSLDGVARVVASRLLAAGVSVRAGLLDDLAWLLFAILLRVLGAAACRTRFAQRTVLAGPINRYSWLRYLSDWEVVLWLVMAFPSETVRHMLPPPPYYNSTMVFLEPFMDLYNVWMWCFLLLMNSRRTTRIRRIYRASMRRNARLTTAI